MSQIIKRQNFAALLSSKVGAFPVGIVTETEPKMRKTGNPYLGTVRTTRRNVFLGGNYESIVNNAKERAGESRDFKAESLPWGTAVNRFLIENKGKLYLRYFPVVNGAKGEDRWTLNGTEIPVEKVQPFLYESAPSNGAGVEWRTVSLENVKTVQMDGEEYILA